MQFLLFQTKTGPEHFFVEREFRTIKNSAEVSSLVITAFWPERCFIVLLPFHFVMILSFSCYLFQHCCFSDSLKMRLSSLKMRRSSLETRQLSLESRCSCYEKGDKTGNLLLSSTESWGCESETKKYFGWLTIHWNNMNKINILTLNTSWRFFLVVLFSTPLLCLFLNNQLDHVLLHVVKVFNLLCCSRPI